MHTALLASQTVQIVLSIQLLHRCHKDMQSLLEPLYTTTDTVTISQKNCGLPLTVEKIVAVGKLWCVLMMAAFYGLSFSVLGPSTLHN